jgi:cytidine deaminase
LITITTGVYSHFKVGATLLVKENATTLSPGSTRYISGANVENAAYPVGTCAERVAMGTAVFEGHRYGSFKALAVATNTEPGSPASPCGMCRQFIREFCEPNMPIIMHDRLGGQVVMTLEQVRCTFETSEGCG